LFTPGDGRNWCSFLAGWRLENGDYSGIFIYSWYWGWGGFLMLELSGKMCCFLHYMLFFLLLGFFGVLWSKCDFSLRGLGLR
jgi:hypothetical protein